MSKKVTTKDFIEKALEIHGERYNYDKTIYTKAKEFVTITCSVHGDFSQRARAHITNKSGCPICGVIRDSWTKEKFIEELKNRCGELPYTVIGEYTGTDNKILTKNKFGICYSIANNLLKGVIPGIESAIDKTQYWINNSINVHGDKYDYSKVIYEHSDSELKIICKKHGEFKQISRSHLAGAGCTFCNSEHRGEIPNGWGYTHWQKAGEKSKNFDSFKVYIIKCWNDEEEFYKIGKTYLKTKQRFKSNKSLPYNYEIVKEIPLENARIICELEETLKNCNKDNKYIPKNIFGGRYECFKELDLSCFEDINTKYK